MKTSKSQRAAVARYDAKNAKHISLKLNMNTDADIIEKLATVDNVNGYVKALIRADICGGK